MSNKSHWENSYTTNAANEISWHQPEPRVSLELIKHAAVAYAGHIIDVGAGASTLFVKSSTTQPDVVICPEDYKIVGVIYEATH